MRLISGGSIAHFRAGRARRPLRRPRIEKGFENSPISFHKVAISAMGDAVDGFHTIRRGRSTALVREDDADRIAEALLDNEGCEVLHAGGRGNLLRFACTGGHGLIRRYQRGGMMRHILRDAYILENRPCREFRLHLHAERQGLSVPPLLGVCWERRGLLLRGAIATQEVAAKTLQEYVEADIPHAEDALRACGTLIRRMHDMDIWHADLQVRNILVGEGGPWIIDFDNAVLRPNLTPLLRARNLLRLRRSIEKNGLPVALFAPICKGYGIEALPPWLSRIYERKGRISDAISGRKHL